MNEIANFVIQPKTLTEAMEFAKMIASSSFCPAAMKSKPGDVILAMQMGAEVGLSPMQALQNIAVINGKPCLYGDGALAVAMSSSQYVSHREWFEGSVKDGNLVAYCGVTRKGSEEYVRAFSMEDAKKANLWSKAGVWQQYPDRMLQMRARSFAIRDKFADALRGINMAEEVNDYVIEKKDSKPYSKSTKEVTPVVNEVINEETGEIESPKPKIVKPAGNLDEFIFSFEHAKSLESLQAAFATMKEYSFTNDEVKKLIDLKDIRKGEIMAAKYKPSEETVEGEEVQPETNDEQA